MNRRPLILRRIDDGQPLMQYPASTASEPTGNVPASKRNVACVVVPTLNEEENVTKLVTAIEKIESVAHVILVDDDSTDGTLQIVHDLVKTFRNLVLVRRLKKKGIGSAITEGITRGLTLSPLPDYIITMDADLSHDPLKPTRTSG